MTSKRSAFITTSAVMVLIGSGVNLFVALTLFMKFPSAPVPVSQSNVLQPSTLNHVISIVSAGFSCWGMVTAIGVLRLRSGQNLAYRISGLLFLMFVRSFLFLALVPDMFRRSGSNRIAAEVFEAVVILLAAFWLWFLNRRTTRAHLARPLELRQHSLR